MEKLIPDWNLNDVHYFTIEYFDKLKKPFTEETMIDILIKQPDRFSIYYAILALRKIGTIKSIQYLKNIICYKNMDIQGTSVLTIAKLANGMENEFLGKLLLNKEFKQKWYALAAIFYKINDKALPYILEYAINKIKNGKNMPETGGLVLLYLAKYAPENEQSKKIFEKINKEYEYLELVVQKTLKEECPNIFGIKNV